MNRRIEILAPAGSYESMRAAMNAGCDAVYIGGGSFGARAYANNLDEETLLRAIDEAHIRNKKLYLTVNTLLKEEELTDRLYRYLEPYYLEGLDAVIVQDPGVMHFIHRNFPKLPIHASTQTTITMAQGANLLKGQGVTRLVTARELSLKEIKAIRENTDLEIETFVHGALCYCYSGQCLMSSMLGGRSGNRGRCAQPCRMNYQFYSEGSRISADREKYLLSPKDINTLRLIPELVEAGIDSFKIEGRMKRPEYAAGVAYIYRKCTDLYLEYGLDRYQAYLKSSEFEQDMTELKDLYNRGGFSEGYGKSYHGKQMMSFVRPNHSGVPVGEVIAVKGNQATILLKEAVHAQDVLEIRSDEEEADYEFTLKDGRQKGETLTTRVGRPPAEAARGRVKYREIQKGASVYRTKNNELLDRLTEAYLERDAKRGIYGRLIARLGEELTLTLTDRKISVTVRKEPVEEAKKQPMTMEKLAEPLKKLGDTLFYFEELRIEADEHIFVPVAWLNELRREAVGKLQEAILASCRRSFAGGDQEAPASQIVSQGEELGDLELGVEAGRENYGNKASQRKTVAESRGQGPYEKNSKAMENIISDSEKTAPELRISVRTAEQFQAALKIAEVEAIYGDYEGFETEELIRMAQSCEAEDKGFYLMLPHICRQNTYQRLSSELIRLWGSYGLKGFVLKNLEELALLQSLQREENLAEKEIILNHNLYIFNREAKEFYREKGVSHYTAPLELNARELKVLGIRDCDMVVYGYQPLMVSTQCLHESTKGCKRCKPGQLRKDYLLDRMGKKFYVQSNCKDCYNVIINGQCLSLLRYAEEVKALIPRNLRLDFTIETGVETKEVISAFVSGYLQGKQTELSADNLTAGHFKRGVE